VKLLTVDIYSIATLYYYIATLYYCITKLPIISPDA